MMLNFTQIRNSLNLAIASTILTALPLCAAEQILILYGPVRLNLGIDSIETFANEGIVNKELDFYLNASGVKQEQHSQLQKALTKRYDIEPIRLHRLLRTPTGEKLLERLGVLISLTGGA